MELGLRVDLLPNDKPFTRFATIAAMGYSGLHINFPEGCDKRLARRVHVACSANGLSLLAVSGYANPLRPTDAPMGWTIEGLRRLIDLMPLMHARALVSWSGTYNTDPFGAHPDNHTVGAWETLHGVVEDLVPDLDAAEAVLLLEPYYTHVLDTAERLATFCSEINSPYLGLVLDPANLLPPAGTEPQKPALAAMVARLANYTRLVHLADQRTPESRPDLPDGAQHLDYWALMRALEDARVGAPCVIERTTIQHARVARAYVLAHAGLRP